MVDADPRATSCTRWQDCIVLGSQKFCYRALTARLSIADSHVLLLSAPASGVPTVHSGRITFVVTAHLAPVLQAMRLTGELSNGLSVHDITERSQLSGQEVRAALRAMVQLEPPWTDADVRPEGGLAWWLTAAGHAALGADDQAASST